MNHPPGDGVTKIFRVELDDEPASGPGRGHISVEERQTLAKVWLPAAVAFVT